ncbi:hypothetical protein ACFX4S_09375 [Kosakonia sp. YIM B13605]|uniref:hypothetical protein n=1 Tax=Kosakonia TaxID=1330547 RepID=UPI0028A59BCE|nr:hypothetical protein [Kosakonia sacchari]
MMELIAKYSTLFSWCVLALFLYLTVKGLREPTGNAKLIKDCATQCDWYGPEKEAVLESWSPLKTTRKGEYFIFHFTIVIDRQTQHKKAAALVKTKEIDRLKQGLKLRVKYQGLAAKRIAVAGMIFDEVINQSPDVSGTAV